MDYTTGQILTAGNEHQQRNPASLTKLMTGYVVDRAIDSHRISFDDIVTVGRDAWAKGNPVFDGSSLMFLKAGDRVSVRDLSRGLIVDSGNDACVALADYVAGGQPQFVAMMNEYVKKLHLQDTHFETVHGLDAPGQHSSAYDLAVLSRAIIHGEPDVYHMYSQKSLTWNGITQQNRNGLLWDKTMNVDGLKTGHTSGAGFNLIASAVDGQRRLIAVVMGADSPKGREQQAAKLLHWGQQNFDTVQVLQKGKRSAANVSGTVIKNKSSWAPIRISGWRCRSRKCRVLKPNTCWIKKISRRRLPQINGSGKSHSMMATKWSPLAAGDAGKRRQGRVFSRMSDYLHHAL
jgi:D-alanyl-D-alanine carboxypeptidase (penicillin-binding protein 5/6)